MRRCTVNRPHRPVRPLVNVLPAVLFVMVVTAPAFSQDYLAYRLQMYVLADDRDQLSTVLSDWADSNDGYFVERSSELVILRVPADHIPALRQMISDSGGLILRYDPSTMDLRQDLQAVRAAVRSRRESLDRILSLMTGADIGSTLAFEQELRSLQNEIEFYQGQERRLVNDTRYAWIRVALTTEASTIPDFIPSSFDWINDVDLYRFLKEQS